MKTLDLTPSIPAIGTHFWKNIPTKTGQLVENIEDADGFIATEYIVSDIDDWGISFEEINTKKIHKWSKKVWLSLYPNLMHRIYWQSLEDATQAGFKFL